MSTYKDIKGNSFENIEDTGTEATKIAVGTTAQRPATIEQGAMRFNSTTGEVEVGDGSAFRKIKNPPEVTSISPSVATNAETSITVTGIGFSSGDVVKFVNSSDSTVTNASSTSFSNSTTLVATATLTTDGTYKIQVVKTDGRIGETATALLTVSDAPTWTTASGALTSAVSGTAYSLTLSATADSAKTFSVQSGSLPTGLSLSSAGVISGTPTATSSTNYSFTVRVTDAENQTADRAFTLQVNIARTLTFILHGAGGDQSSPRYNGSSVPGNGGLVQADMTFNTGTVLYIAVDQGSANNGGDSHGGYTGAAGRKSGGYAGVFVTSIAHANARLIAGGGGADCGFNSRNGGNGGGTTGGSGTNSYGGSGGSQSAGGSGNGSGSAGSALQGGTGGAGDDAGGAGGGGYYGGGGGKGGGFTQVGSGGGGSSYIHSSATNTTDTQGGGAGAGGIGKVEIQDSGGTQLYLKNTTGTDTYTVV